MTYSIVARDPVSGDFGVAIASRSFNLSWLCSWAAAGVGVVVTQASTNPAFGPRGLDMLRAGSTSTEVVTSLIEADSLADDRQVAVVDRYGSATAHTGGACHANAGHLLGAGYSVQGNLLSTTQVVPAMAGAFEGTDGPLPHRLLASMEAGQRAGGDARGRQSAVLLSVSGDPASPEWARLVDFQVADSPDPLGEVRRLLDLQDRLQRAGRGVLAVFDGRTSEALDLLEPMHDDVPEIAFNRVLALFAAGRIEDANDAANRLYEMAPHWRGLRLYADRVPGASEFLDNFR